MTSARSCNNPERTWLTEILRRCKALPVLIAVAYFLSNILPILLSYSSFETVVTYVNGAMLGTNIFNYIIGIAGGVVVSCASFKYLHSTASVIDAHCRPLTRIQLFRGSFVAGLIMVAAPVVLTGVFYLCMMGAHFSVSGDELLHYWDSTMTIPEILSVSNIIGWVVDNIIVIGFTYCVSCFAAILAGTAAVQALLSLVLVALPSVIYFIIETYMSSFLYGYPDDSRLVTYLSPYMCLAGRYDYPFSSVPAGLIIHVIIAVLLVFAAAFIYRRIRLENEEQTIVVPFVAEALVVILTVIAASMVLFVAQVFLPGRTALGAIVTLILATAVFFPIFCMIADQSFRIFKSRNVKVLLIYIAVMCGILTFTLFDVTGYEKNVPDVSDIASVDLQDLNLYNPDVKGMTDEETLALITNLHESMAGTEEEAKDIFSNTNDAGSTSINSIDISYKLKNGKTVHRYYGAITPSAFDSYAAYYDSRKIREQECCDLKNAKREGLYETITDIHPDSDANCYLVPEEYKEGLVEAANKDIMKWTAKNRGLFNNQDQEYDPATDNSTYALEINVDYRISGAKITKLEKYSSYRPMTADDKNVLAYLEAHPEILSDKNILSDNDPRRCYDYSSNTID